MFKSQKKSPDLKSHDHVTLLLLKDSDVVRLSNFALPQGRDPDHKNFYEYQRQDGKRPLHHYGKYIIAFNRIKNQLQRRNDVI